MNARKKLSEQNEEILFLTEKTYDKALVGIVTQFGKPTIACYDKNKIIKILTKDGMTKDEAEEFFEFNIVGAYVGESTPCFVEKLKNIEFS